MLTFSTITGEDTPELADLYRNIVPHCATRWESLGAELGLEQHHLALISKNNAFNPDRNEDCCKAVLEKWLNIDLLPNWGKLEDAVNTIEDSPILHNDVTGVCCAELCLGIQQ